MRPIIRPRRRAEEAQAFGFPIIGDAAIVRDIEWTVLAPPPPATAAGVLARLANPLATRQRKVIAAWRGERELMVYVPRHFMDGKATAAQLIDIQRELVEAVRDTLKAGAVPKKREAWSGRPEGGEALASDGDVPSTGASGAALEGHPRGPRGRR